MLTGLGVLGGAIWGALLARKRGGNRMDVAQYGAGFAIMWGLIGLIATIVLVSRG